MTTARPALAAAVAVLALALSACSSDPAPSTNTVAPPPETNQAAEEAPAAKPDAHKARILDILSGEMLRVQIHTDVYGDVDMDAANPRTVVVRDPRIDAPERGECGFEETMDLLVNEIIGRTWPESANMPEEPWTPEQDVTVTLTNAELLEVDYPEADPDGTELFEIDFSRKNVDGWDDTVALGYARANQEMPEGYSQRQYMLDAQARAETASEAPGLYATCWADLYTGPTN